MKLQMENKMETETLLQNQLDEAHTYLINALHSLKEAQIINERMSVRIKSYEAADVERRNAK
jgi:hypothetical protein